MSIPVLYFAFANDKSAHLELLKKESGAVRDAFRLLASERLIDFHREESAETQEVFDDLTHFGNRLALFHYAGHADSTSLRFEEGAGAADGIAGLLGRERSLKLVFLNGCATKAQVAALWSAGVPAVIATSVPINDKKAAEFSEAFYKSLANGRRLEDAFGRAGAFLRTNYGRRAKIGQVHRGVSLHRRREAMDAASPWGLWVNPDDADDVLEWNLPQLERPRSEDEPDAPPPTSEEKLPPALEEVIKTRDRGDEIHLTSRHTPGIGGVRLCLELRGVSWWKRIEVGAPERQSDKTEFRRGIEGHGPGLKDCMLVEPARPVRLYFRKAKFLGRKAASVNELYRDLTGWNDHTLTFSWVSD